MIKNILTFAMVLWGGAALIGLAQEDPYAPPIVLNADSVHNVGRLEVSIPSGWEKRRLNDSNFLAISKDKVNGYTKNLSVKEFKGRRYIDEITAKSFKELVNNKYKASLKSITGYETEDPEFVDLVNGNEAILLYSTFNMGGLDLMHMHIVVSGDFSHYLVTYTDLHSNLSQEESKSFQLAWNLLSNVNVPFTPGSGRYEQTIYTVIGGGSFFLAIVTLLFIRKRLAGKQIDGFNEDDHDELDDELDADEWVTDSSKKYIEDDDDIDSDDDFEETA